MTGSLTKKLAVIYLAAMAAMGWFVVAPAVADAQTPRFRQGFSAPDPAAEQAFVDRINQLRASKGLGALTIDAELTDIGRRWAATMAEAGDIWHNPDFASWVKNPSWTTLGENVGLGPDVPTLHQAFVDSPGHYRNLVDARFTRIGVGVVYGDDGVMYTSHQFMAVADAVAPTAPPPATTAPRPRPTAPPAPPTTAAEVVPDAPLAGSARVAQYPLVLERLGRLDPAAV